MYNKVVFVILFFSFLAAKSQSNNSSVEKIYKKLSEKNLKYIQFSDSISLIHGKEKRGKQEVEFELVESNNPLFFYIRINLRHSKIIRKNLKQKEVGVNSSASFCFTEITFFKPFRKFQQEQRNKMYSPCLVLILRLMIH